MWQLLPGKGINTVLFNPASSSRFDVEVSGDCIRNPEHKVTFPVIDPGAQVTLDTFKAWGLGTAVTISWHDRADHSDQRQRWSSEIP